MRQLRFLAISLITVAISAGCLGGGSSMQTSADGPIGVENDAGAGGVGGSVPGTGGMSSTGGTAELGGVTGTAPPVADGYRLDVLFMVGKTASMGDAQRRLSAAAPAFLVELRRRNLRDVRIAVGSADMGIEGRYEPLAGPDCSDSVGDIGLLPTSGRCLKDAPFLHIQGNTVAPSGDLNEALACLLRVGTTGCVYTQPIKAFFDLWLVDRATKVMRNFFRPEAELLVIIVSDEDDCSTGGPKEASILASKPGQFRRLRCATFGHMCDGMPLEAREQSLPLATCRDLVSTEQLVAIPDILPKLEEIRTSKREGRAAMKISGEPRIMIASLSGWPSQADLPTARYEYRRFTSPVSGESMLDLAPVCGQGEGAARPGLRLRRLAERLPPGDGLYLSICGDDLRPALIQAASLP